MYLKRLLLILMTGGSFGSGAQPAYQAPQLFLPVGLTEDVYDIAVSPDRRMFAKAAVRLLLMVKVNQ
jgi:hypothetical protein